MDLGCGGSLQFPGTVVPKKRPEADQRRWQEIQTEELGSNRNDVTTGLGLVATRLQSQHCGGLGRRGTERELEVSLGSLKRLCLNTTNKH